MKKILFLFILLTFSLGHSAVWAKKIPCNQFYVVKKGDSLQKIALRAYGRASAYQILYSSNRSRIGRLPGIIKANRKIWVPCLVKNVRGKTHVKKQPATVNAASTRRKKSPDVELVTGSDFAPFTDLAAPQGGLFTELVDRALKRADKKLVYEIDFVSDWSAHLKVLLPKYKYDMSFPWYKPDCTKIKLLGEASKYRCKHLLFSDPFFEVVVSFFGKKSKNLNITSPQDLKGLKLCRPSGFFTHDLEVRKLTTPYITMFQPETVGECFRMLKDDEVDIVTLNLQTADNTIKQLNMKDDIEIFDSLSTIETLHVVVRRTHRKANTLMLRINRGFRELEQSGENQKIVERHLLRYMNSEKTLTK